MFFGQTAFMLLGGSALVDPGRARWLFAGLLTAYELVFVARLGQTPGKDLLRVKVAAAGTLDSPGAARALRRWLVAVPVLLAPNVVVAAGLAAASAAVALVVAGRAAHDLAGGTWVVAYDADAEEGRPADGLEPLDRLRRSRRLLG